VNLPALSVRRPVATAMIGLMVVVVGAFSLWRLPIDLLPDVELPSVTVSAEYENAAPEEIERLVTEPIEEAVATVQGVEEIVSTSSEGVSSVRIRFTWGTNLDAAASDVRDRLDRVVDELPDDATRPELRKFDVSNAPIVLLGLSSSLDPVELAQVLDDQVLYRLERIPGVAAVDVWGEYTREIRIELDIGKIKALRLPLEAVLTAIGEANVNVPAGNIDQGRYEVRIRTPGEFRGLDELAATVVAVREGGPVRLSDIAEVRDTHREMTRLVRIDGRRGVRLAIRKQSDANTAAVARAALAEVEAINRDMPQLRIVPVVDQGRYIERSIANVGQSVVYGGGLAVLVLLLFLRNVRSTLVIAVSIPVSVVATFALIYFCGFTLNLMTLGGLALGVGMMVDNSIVVLENIFRRRHEEGEGTREASVRGAGEVAGAIVASTLTTLVIFLPLVFARGTSGVLFRELAYVIAFSLAVSLAVALTLVPMMSSRLLGRERPRESRARPVAWLLTLADRTQAGLERAYGGVLRDALRARWATVLVVAGLAVGSSLLVPMIGTEFMPPSDEGQVRVSGEMEQGTRLELVDRQTRLLEQLALPHVPELVSYVASVGASSWNPDQASEGELQLALTPLAQRSRTNTEIADELRELLVGRVPGMKIRTRAPQGQWLLNRIIGGDEGFAVEIRGYDLDILDALAAEVATILEQTPGVTDIRYARDQGVPQQLIRIDRDKAADLGLSVERVARTLETAIGGTRAGEYREAGDEYRILVRLRDAESIPLEEILDLTLTNTAGEEVALRNLVVAEPGQGPLLIERKDRQRVATVSANLSGQRDMGSVARDVAEALRAVPRPSGYDFSLAGNYEEQQKAFNELAITLALSLVLVYMVLACQYESLRDPLVVMLSVPAAGIGVLVTLFLTGTTLNVQSYIGCIMLGGIVVNNAILLVDQAGQIRREKGWGARQAVAEAGRRRLRPILMTTLTTILGLLPLAFGIGEGAEAQAPLARAVVGGLLFSTLVSLVLVPAVYTLVHPEPPEV